jgi:hypothetical protein
MKRYDTDTATEAPDGQWVKYEDAIDKATSMYLKGKADALCHARKIEPDEVERCPVCDGIKESPNVAIRLPNGDTFHCNNPFHSTGKKPEVLSFVVTDIKNNCLTPCPHRERVMVGSVACQRCDNFGGYVGKQEYASEIYCNRKTSESED